MTDEKQPKQQDEQSRSRPPWSSRTSGEGKGKGGRAKRDQRRERGRETDEVKGGGRLTGSVAPTRRQQVRRLSRTERRGSGGAIRPPLSLLRSTPVRKDRAAGGNALDQDLFRAGGRSYAWRDVVPLGATARRLRRAS